MTGQVKEDILSRFGELGLRVKEGRLCFDFSLLKEKEYLTEPAVFQYFNVQGEQKSIALDPGSLAFTYCQVPIIYKKGAKNALEVYSVEGQLKKEETLTLDFSTTNDIFDRNHKVEKIIVNINQ